ncbi:MAG: hypothetical protein IJT34_05810 [Butyrivibrio sp.]|nr:hypothetical protein [Butyrivibrio sp.]
MGQILTYIMFAFMCIVGGGSSIFVLAAIPVVIIWKLYRWIRFHENPMGGEEH